MKDKFLILDDVLSQTYLKYLIDYIFDVDWKFFSNLTYGNYLNDTDYEYGFTGKLSENQKHFFLPLIFEICDRCNIKINDLNQISRIDPRLQTKLSSTCEVNDIHVDSDKGHYAIIFYPHDIDGETILYNETTSDLSYHKFSQMPQEERDDLTKKFTILKKIEPKKNRAVIFNGNRFHSSSSPSKGPRCIVNINVLFDNDGTMCGFKYE
jgi:hypothetical protein